MAEKHREFNKRLIVVSNRLPIVISNEDGNWEIRPGSGGLITALDPIMKLNRGLWVGWPGAGEDAPIDELHADVHRNGER